MLSKAKSTGLLDNAPTKDYLDNKINDQLSPYYIENEETLINKIGIMNNLDNEYTVEETKLFLDGIINKLLR